MAGRARLFSIGGKVLDVDVVAAPVQPSHSKGALATQRGDPGQGIATMGLVSLPITLNRSEAPTIPRKTPTMMRQEPTPV